VLPDGVYDVLVVDADEEDGAIRLELTILAGDQKGEVVNLASPNMRGEPALRLGTPGTLTVTDGVPGLRLEP
jgi:hypothetical protein